jgi:dipicolinate synthase subunit B
MAAKAHLRNDRPVVVAVASNDGLSGAARNLGELLVRKNYYLEPYR